MSFHDLRKERLEKVKRDEEMLKNLVSCVTGLRQEAVRQGAKSHIVILSGLQRHPVKAGSRN